MLEGISWVSVSMAAVMPEASCRARLSMRMVPGPLMMVVRSVAMMSSLLLIGAVGADAVGDRLRLGGGEFGGGGAAEDTHELVEGCADDSG